MVWTSEVLVESLLRMMVLTPPRLLLHPPALCPLSHDLLIHHSSAGKRRMPATALTMAGVPKPVA